MKTQHQKILEMCEGGRWVCQVEFWDNYIRSPHKRRTEIENGEAKSIPKREYEFETRKCTHGLPQSYDYRLKEKEPSQPHLL